MIVLMARAERSYLETISSFIPSSNSMLEPPSRLDHPATPLQRHFACTAAPIRRVKA
jgi:hypothetical protein